MQRNHFVFGWRHVVTVNDNKASEQTADAQRRSGSTRLLLDHVSGVRPRAAAAVPTQQTAHVRRVVGREVRDNGSTLHTPQMFLVTAGGPAGAQQQKLTSFRERGPPQPPPPSPAALDSAALRPFGRRQRRFGLSRAGLDQGRVRLRLDADWLNERGGALQQ